MAIIIGNGTTIVSSQFTSGITSVQFAFNPSVERLYELGQFNPYDTTVTKTRSLTINVYGKRANGTGGSVPYDVTPSTSCVDANPISVTINPASCVGALLPFSADYYLTGYSYQKDNIGTGQETWTFTTKPEISGFTGTIVMLRGVAEGTISTGDGVMASNLMGVSIDETASNDSFGSQIQGESGSVQAGATSVGEFTVTRSIVATSVGGSTARGTSVDGLTGQANITIPITTVYT